MPSRIEFLVYSVLLRVTEGIGSGAYSTGMYTMASILYPKSTGTVVVSEGREIWLIFDRLLLLQGILEVGSAIGYMLGPPLGGVLFQVIYAVFLQYSSCMTLLSFHSSVVGFHYHLLSLVEWF